MQITDIFPALLERHEKRLNKNPSWTKRGPGRRHNYLTKKQQDSKDFMTGAGGLNASKALELLGVI